MADQGMLAPQRRALIVQSAKRDGAVRVVDLAAELGVSGMTVRRDLDALAREGVLEKVHGGAVPAGVRGREPGFEAKAGLESAAKAAIAAAAAALVRPGSVVALSGGTTTHAVASRLLEVPDLTVVTNSLAVARVLEEASYRRAGAPVLVLTGGTPTRSAALVGPVADRMLASVHVDLLILGVHGVSERAGLTTPNMAEAQTNRALITAASRLAVVADHSKWGVVGLSGFARLDEVDCYVTDAGLPDRARELLEGQVGELVVAEDPAA
ncbi:DeoR/GlpR family DNA-binding transcription regulator [Kitasatospora cineracea]|uniref:DeoR family transcriptional regulator n=1 Tax=Kitasatospora cineracea TaxID=88074 RepID=A0A8G1UM57_9ACTN|nr:DeoR/GlpR family DNA-binding transcription regulator [Kitasatospora cineracea]ROR46408.1 DeoR family transcriptional regulator [Kitasatospora cineracea]